MIKRLIRESRINKSWVFLFSVHLLTSCGLPIKVPDIEELPGGENVVFGRIAVSHGHPDFFWGEVKSRVHIMPEAGREPVPYEYIATGDGSFYWQLPSGGYVITDFILYRGATLLARRGVLARFVVPEASVPVYIGALRIYEGAGRRYTINVEDHYDEAVQKLKERFPEISGPVTKRLMKLR